MLVLAKHFVKTTPDHTLRFVAFTNEEPPYFQATNEMRSSVDAKMCGNEEQNIVGLISLETMGFFTPPRRQSLGPYFGTSCGFAATLLLAPYRYKHDNKDEASDTPDEINFTVFRKFTYGLRISQAD